MFMGQVEKGEEKLPISLTMRAALAVSALATLYIGILPNRFIELVNWALGIAQNPAIAKLTPVLILSLPPLCHPEAKMLLRQAKQLAVERPAVSFHTCEA